MAVSMKMAVFWAVAPCRLVKVYYVSEVRTASNIWAITHNPVDGGSMDL
jgi:hypothetical protein